MCLNRHEFPLSWWSHGSMLVIYRSCDSTQHRSLYPPTKDDSEASMGRCVSCACPCLFHSRDGNLHCNVHVVLQNTNLHQWTRARTTLASAHSVLSFENSCDIALVGLHLQRKVLISAFLPEHLQRVANLLEGMVDSSSLHFSDLLGLFWWRLGCL